MTARALVDAAMSEADLQRTVTDALTVYRWRWTHFGSGPTGRYDKRSGKPIYVTALTGAPGWPDIFAVRGARAMAIECKSAKGKPTAQQVAWLTVLGVAGIEVWLVGPANLDELLEVLR